MVFTYSNMYIIIYSMKDKFFGFTLAEVLITLGIIGVIAAMTIPQLLADYQNRKNSAMLKEDYAILQQMMLMANDNGALANIVIGNNEDEMKEWFETYFMPYIKTTDVCYFEWGCWSKNFKNLRGENINQSGQCGNKTISFILPNGSYACMDDFNGSRFGVPTEKPTILLLVDVNGSGQPNVMGKDVFAMVFRNDELLPGGFDMTEDEIEKNCSKNCSGASFSCGSYCMTKVMKNDFRLPVAEDK